MAVSLRMRSAGSAVKRGRVVRPLALAAVAAAGGLWIALAPTHQGSPVNKLRQAPAVTRTTELRPLNAAIATEALHWKTLAATPFGGPDLRAAHRGWALAGNRPPGLLPGRMTRSRQCQPT